MTKRIIIIAGDNTDPRLAAMLAQEANVSVVTIDAETQKIADEHGVDVTKATIDTISVFPELTNEALDVIVNSQVIHAAMDNNSVPSPIQYMERGIVDEIVYNKTLDIVLENRLGLRSGNVIDPVDFDFDFDRDNIPTNSAKPDFLLRENHRITKVRR